MTRMTYLDAISSAIREEMRQNLRVFVMGHDIQTWLFNGSWRPEFDTDRVRNTPISESGFIGAGIGAALTGMRPIIELGCSTFLYSAMDQVVNQAAKMRYMFGGQASVPLLIRAPVLYNISVAAHHSDRPWGLFAQAPGLKIIVPTTPYDAKGLITSALRDSNPILCFEDATLVESSGEVPEGTYTIPIGLADLKRNGSDITLVALAGSVLQCLTASSVLESVGISAEVIDLRTVVPLDKETILKSIAKTGHLIVVDPAPGMCSVASEVAALVAEHAFEHLRAPIVRLTAPDLPVPFSQRLERLLYPTAEKIVIAARRQLGRRPPE